MVDMQDKIYIKTCVTNEDSDQPAHLCSPIKVFTDHLCLLQPPDYPKRDKPLQYWVDVQADLCWLLRSYCRFCRALAHMIHNKGKRSLCHANSEGLDECAHLCSLIWAASVCQHVLQYLLIL